MGSCSIPLGFVHLACQSLASHIVRILGRSGSMVIVLDARRQGNVTTRHTTVRRLLTTNYSIPIVLRHSCERASVRTLRLGTTISFKALLLSNFNSKVVLRGRKYRAVMASDYVFNVLRTAHAHVDGARCVSYPDYKHALCSLRAAVTHVGGTASRLGNLGVNVVKYVIGNPNRVTSTSCNCINTKGGQVDLCGNGRYILGGVPRRRTMRQLIRLVGRDKS